MRPGLRELAALEPLVISAGFHELIEPVLGRERVELKVLANRVDARPDGWVVRFRDETACATCGEPCKRGSLAGEPYVYAGDGYSDRCAALAADRVFARDSLAAASRPPRRRLRAISRSARHRRRADLTPGAGERRTRLIRQSVLEMPD